MSYALISEAWKIKDEKLKERDFKERPAVNRIIEPFDNVEKFPSSTKKLVEDKEIDGLAYQYYQDFIPDEDDGYETDDELDHGKVLEHIKNCPICQSKIKIENKGILDIPDKVLDILLYTITGIFILFLLDIVLRLGKSLT